MKIKQNSHGNFSSKKILAAAISIFFCALNFSCSKENPEKKIERESTIELKKMLERDGELSEKSRYAIMNQLASKMLEEGASDELLLLLTEFVEKNPRDKYNSYWLLMCAYSYIEMGQEKVAEYYFERILRCYDDLVVKGQSIHFLCLERLVQISENSESRISYFNTLMSRFPEKVSLTEMYARLASEYERLGDWTRALRMYKTFLAQRDAGSIQIMDMRDIYNHARSLIVFDNSPKNWMFKSLDELSDAVKSAITRNQGPRLDAIRSKANFFTVSGRSSEGTRNSQASFSIQNYMHGNRINFSEELLAGENANEAYLRTSGWTEFAPEWCFYFRKVNFPAEPKVHGTWEWAGIYMGDSFKSKK